MFTSLKAVINLLTKDTIMGFYYAVAKGRKPGIYHTWDECKAQVHKFTGPIYKKFPTAEEAQAFINARSQSALPRTRLLSSENFVPTKPRQYRRTKRLLDSEETTANDILSVRKRIRTVTSGIGSTSNSSKNDKNNHFDMDPNGFVNVYTDGACSSNGYQGAKAGVGVYFGENSPLNVSAPVVGRATNNMAEIQAVTRAAEVARENGMTKLRIHTDSEFLIKSATQWMDGWKRRGWTTSTGKPVINKAELQEMESALGPLDVEWNHVRGHCGVHGNEMADRLAREGAERYKKH